MKLRHEVKEAIVSALLLLLVLLVIAIGFTQLTGCKSWRKIGNTKTEKLAENRVSKDSTGITDKSKSNNNTSNTEVHVKFDSTALIPGEEISVDLEPEDIHPVTDVKGKKQDRTFTNSKGHIQAEVTIGKDGKIRIRCKEDSFRLVVFRYRQDSIALVRKIDSIVTHSTANTSVHTDSLVSVSEHSSVLQKQDSWFGRTWQRVKDKFAWFGLICTLAIIVWCVWRLFRTYIKAQVPFLK